MIASLLLTLLFAVQTPATSSGLLGNWKTPDNSVVSVYACEGSTLCARVVTIGPKDKPQTDTNNPDATLRSRRICGLTIGTGFAPDSTTSAKDGKIYDPKSGKTYSAQMQGDGDSLKLRGYVGISLLGRTEIWHRAGDPGASCQ